MAQDRQGPRGRVNLFDHPDDAPHDDEKIIRSAPDIIKTYG